MNITKIVLIICATVGFYCYRTASSNTGQEGSAKASSRTEGVSGLYVVEYPQLKPQLSFRFLDDRKVEMYANGKVSGPMCSYKKSGNFIQLTHKCGVMELDVTDEKGDVLVDRSNNFRFRRASY